MQRRAMFGAILAGIAGLGGSAKVFADDSPKAMRVVYHLCDVEKVDFVLACVMNHISAAGRAADFRIAVVVHGPALSSFRRQFPFASVAQGMGLAIERGASFYACANTMASDRLNLDDLLAGFQVTHRGGVAYLADLQAAGWAYLRP